MRTVVLAAIPGLLASFLASTPARAAAPTAQEQLFLYEVNRARSDPAGWAAELGLGARTGGDGLPTTLVGVPPRPPLALDETLVDSARFKAAEMASADYFDHPSAVDGRWPNELLRDTGYPLPATLPLGGGFFAPLADDSNQVESLACGFGPGSFDFTQAGNAVAGLVVDEGVPSLGHRIHLLAIDDPMTPFVDLNPLYREAGAGFGSNASSECRNYWAFHTGVVDTAQSFLTGVVFADGDGDELYDAGEGLGGVTVLVGATPVLTNPAGGWSLPVEDGTHDVTCSGGAFAGTGAASVEVAGANREVDCISGFPGAYVDFLAVPEPAGAAAGLSASAALASLARRTRRRRA